MIFGFARLFGTLLVNSIPLIGVVWFDWSVFEVLFLYWFENLAIGVAHAARLVISTRTNAISNGWPTTTFFMLHYGLFTLVHGVFVVVFFGVIGGGLGEVDFGFVGPVFAVVIWQVAFLYIDAVHSEQFKGREPDSMMFAPYPRVFALHIAVIAGGWVVGETGAPIWALAALVAVKSLFDLGVAAFDSFKMSDANAAFSALRKRRD